LNAAIKETIDNLASPAGLLFKSLLPRDPTGELLNISDQLTRARLRRAAMAFGFPPDATRALAVAQTAASGSDSDAQSKAIDAIRAAFCNRCWQTATGPNNGVQLRLSGPGYLPLPRARKSSGPRCGYPSPAAYWSWRCCSPSIDRCPRSAWACCR